MPHIPSFSERVKPGAKVLALAMVVENPDGQMLVVRPKGVTGFVIDVETHWKDNTFTQMSHQTGRLELRFDALVIEEVRPKGSEPTPITISLSVIKAIVRMSDGKDEPFVIDDKPDKEIDK